MENKKQFISELSTVISKYCSDITSIEYFKPGSLYNEEVVVIYKGSHEDVVNVTYDSCLQMLLDVCRNSLQKS